MKPAAKLFDHLMWKEEKERINAQQSVDEVTKLTIEIADLKLQLLDLQLLLKQHHKSNPCILCINFHKALIK